MKQNPDYSIKKITILSVDNATLPKCIILSLIQSTPSQNVNHLLKQKYSKSIRQI